MQPGEDAIPCLRALGGLDLKAGGAEVRPLQNQPKRLGILVFLASTQSSRRRDTLLGLFWPELDQERARGALRQALYMLRRELGEDALPGRGEDEVGVDHNRLHLDTAAFERAATNGDSRAAMELYRGDFLDGFFVSGAAVEFENWVSAERARLRALAAQTAWALAESEAACGGAEASVWIRRAVGLSPDDESALRRAVSLLDHLGDRAGALQLYHEFRDRLAREYGASPAAQTEALGAALRKPNGALPAAVPAAASPPPPPAAEPAAVVPGPEPAAGRTVRRHSWPFVLAGAAALAVVTMAVGLARPRAPASPPLDLDRVVVVPFRVSAADSGLGYLREGMLDLLEAKMASEVGPRLVDPRQVLSLWRKAGGNGVADIPTEASLSLAKRVGGGRLLVGSVVGGPEGVGLQATLIRVADGTAERPVMVRGPRDSVVALVDRFAAALALSALGEEEQRLDDLTSRSLPALQAYLAGKRSYRAGAYDSAAAQFERALDLDSTFALAGLTLASSQGYWGRSRSGAGRGVAVAKAWETRLPPRDREFLRYVAEPNYPGAATLHDKITNWEEATIRFPDRPEAWFQLGDNLYHWGLQIGIADAERRAANAFDHAIALDSSLAPALEHRLWLAASARDTQVLRRLGPAYLATHPVAERLVPHQWRVAAATGDSVTLRGIRGRLRNLPSEALQIIYRISQEEFPSPADAESTAAEMARRASTANDQHLALILAHDLALNRGQARRAAASALSARAIENPNWTDSEGRVLIYDALYQEGDQTAAAMAAADLARRADQPLPAERKARGRRYYDLCAAAQWRLAQGDLEYARRAAERLGRTREPQDFAGDVAEHHVCAAMLTLRLALVQRSPLEEPSSRLDSLLIYGPWVYALIRQAAILTLAEAHERRGDIGLAVATIHRRDLDRWNRFITTWLREEGRLTAIQGDTAAAVRAYDRYLALRDQPEPSLAAEVNRVREERNRLGRGQ
jgi:DNA-binding SARP family transcriptional activator